MRSESGFRRIVNFSDAVVAIAITLLVLPLVDAAGSIDRQDPVTFLSDNRTRLFAFALSFAVIGSFWWAQHQLLERVRSYNTVLISGMSAWLFCIVFLPFPTELLGSASDDDTAVHGIYIGTMLVAAVAGLVQQWAIVRWPELQDEEDRGSVTLVPAVTLVVLMTVALLAAVALPSVGLWGLLVLLLSRPIEHLATAKGARGQGRRRVRPPHQGAP